MVSFTPFVGLHFILAGFIAFATGGNIVASAFGTAIGNPLTFPFIWALSYRVGLWVLGHRDAVAPPIDMSAGLLAYSKEALLPVIKPMLVGAVPLGLIAWVVFYFLVKALVRSFQDARRRRLEKNAARRATVQATSVGSK
jgi:uncharacterized protein